MLAHRGGKGDHDFVGLVNLKISSHGVLGGLHYQIIPWRRVAPYHHGHDRCRSGATIRIGVADCPSSRLDRVKVVCYGN